VFVALEDLADAAREEMDVIIDEGSEIGLDSGQERTDLAAE
jgi:hypothetical protein